MFKFNVADYKGRNCKEAHGVSAIVPGPKNRVDVKHE